MLSSVNFIYMKEVDNTVRTLFREGPDPEAKNHAVNLMKLKLNYAAWLPEEIALTLKPFEDAVLQIGILAMQEKTLNRTGDKEGRIEEMYKTFQKVLNLNNQYQEDSDKTVEAVKQKIRAILGIEELTKMRIMLVKEALRFLERTPR